MIVNTRGFQAMPVVPPLRQARQFINTTTFIPGVVQPEQVPVQAVLAIQDQPSAQPLRADVPSFTSLSSLEGALSQVDVTRTPSGTAQRETEYNSMDLQYLISPGEWTGTFHLPFSHCEATQH